MNKSWIIIGIVWTSAILSGWAGTVSPPWSDNFESFTNGTPLVNGTNGWYGSSSNIIVQTNTVYSGTNAAKIPVDCTLSNRCIAGAFSNVWTEMYSRMTLYDGIPPPALDTNATAMFYVNSSGYIVVQNGTPTNWVVVSNMVDGTAATVISATNWSHLYVYQNFTKKTWAVFLNYDLMKVNIGFVDTNISNLSDFDLYSGNSTTFLDNVSIITSNPPDLYDHATNWIPYLCVGPTSMSRTILNGTNAPSQTFEVWTTNSTLSVVYSNSVSTNWLTVDTTNGTTAGEHDTITVNYDTTTLTPSTNPYTATIQVTGVDDIFGFTAYNSPQTINVSLTVNTRPQLRVNPWALTNVVSYGHSASAQAINVWNGSATPRTPMFFSVTNNNPAWITVNPTNGSCIDNTNTLTCTYPTESLSPGWYTGWVTVVTTVSSNQPVQVNMRVNATPSIGVNVQGLTNFTRSGYDAISQTFTISNASVSPRSTLHFNLSDNVTWATLSPTEGTSTGEVTTATVTYSTATLPVGVHTGSITVAGIDEATGDAVDSAIISVTMTIEGSAQLSTSVDQLNNSILENCAATNTFRLWNGSIAPQGKMVYVISEDISWLSVTPTEGTVSDDTNTISVIYSAGTLATGTYVGTITIDAMDTLTGTPAAGAPKSISVTLVITPRTPVNYELPEVRGILYVGQTLNAWRGLWQNENRLAFTYQWQMANDKYGNGLTDITDTDGILVTTTNYVVTTAARAKYLRIKVTATDAVPWPIATIAYSVFTDSRRIKAPVDDFSGDGRTDLWLFDAASGIWQFAFTTDSKATVEFGGSGCLAKPGDYDGDGKADLAIYEESTGLWTVMLSASGYATASVLFGGPGYSPVPNDYDGDCKIDPATYKDITGLWTVLMSASSYMPASAVFGGTGYQPVPGDYDGDGKTDPATYHAASGLWQMMLSGSAYALAGLEFGGPDYTPTPGDYDGDGKTDLAVYWIAGNRWWLRSSLNGTFREKSFGTSNGLGIPMPGYYDHDIQCDPATVHISDDFIHWCIQRSSLGYRGQSFQIDTDQWRVSW